MHLSLLLPLAVASQALCVSSLPFNLPSLPSRNAAELPTLLQQQQQPSLPAAEERFPPTASSWGTVFPFTVEAYTGRWYQAQENAFSAFVTGQGEVECSHADYALLSNGSISVSNNGQRKNTAEYTGVKGVAFAQDPVNKPAALTLTLFGATPFPTSYDIIALGPIKNGRYQWAIVSDPLRAQLYTLVRDFNAYRTDETLRAQIADALEQAGFVFPFNAPTDLRQGDGCTYQPLPASSRQPTGVKDTDTVTQDTSLFGLQSPLDTPIRLPALGAQAPALPAFPAGGAIDPSAFAMLFGDVSAAAGLGRRVPPTVLSQFLEPRLDIPSYLGRWYQVQENPTSSRAVRGGGSAVECSTADYGLLDNGTISILNIGQRVDTKEPTSITGIAYAEDPNKPAALAVELWGGAPFPVSYDIAKLGPVENGQYQWAIVTDPFRAGLFTLVRDPSRYATDGAFRSSIDTAVRNAGFVFPWNSPQPTKQGEGCKYAPIPESQGATISAQSTGSSSPVSSEASEVSPVDALSDNVNLKAWTLDVDRLDAARPDWLSTLQLKNMTNLPVNFGSAAAASQVGVPVGRRVPPTVLSQFLEPRLDIPSYLGRWYQVLDNPQSSRAVRGGGSAVECSTAVYGLFDNGTISVFNQGQRVDTKEPTSITGIAYAEDPNKPAALAVELWGGAPFPASYDIAKLGPIEQGRYQWAIVTDPFRAGLFVLVRDFNRYYNDQKFKTEVDVAVRDAGFTTPFNAPTPVKQGEGCTYGSVAAQSAKNSGQAQNNNQEATDNGQANIVKGLKVGSRSNLLKNTLGDNNVIGGLKLKRGA